jgi:hypothetical protein
MADLSQAGSDVYLFGIPLIALLVFGFFRLDEVFTFRKREHVDPPGPLPVSKRHERSMRSDPDGRPWDDH